MAFGQGSGATAAFVPRGAPSMRWDVQSRDVLR